LYFVSIYLRCKKESESTALWVKCTKINKFYDFIYDLHSKLKNLKIDQEAGLCFFWCNILLYFHVSFQVSFSHSQFFFVQFWLTCVFRYFVLVMRKKKRDHVVDVSCRVYVSDEFKIWNFEQKSPMKILTWHNSKWFFVFTGKNLNKKENFHFYTSHSSVQNDLVIIAKSNNSTLGDSPTYKIWENL
jgi:hypothetical protein